MNHRIRAMLLILWVPGMPLNCPSTTPSLGVSWHSGRPANYPDPGQLGQWRIRTSTCRARSGTPIQRHAERRSSTSPYRPIIPALLLNTAMTKPTVTALSPASGPLAGVARRSRYQDRDLPEPLGGQIRLQERYKLHGGFGE